MKQDFYYADLDWKITIDDGKSGTLKSMVGVELQVLQLHIWHAISMFLTTRALYLTEPDVTAKKLDDARKRDNEYKGEE